MILWKKLAMPTLESNLIKTSHGLPTPFADLVLKALENGQKVTEKI